MLLALALALMAAAEPPCVEVRLPAGEAAEDWEAPLELAGLCQGDEEAPVAVFRDEGRWRVAASTAAGVREARVAPPRTPADREDVAWLLASLARDPPALGFLVPPLPSPAPRRPAPDPEPEPGPEPRPEPEPEPEPASEPEPVPAREPEPEAPGPAPDPVEDAPDRSRPESIEVPAPAPLPAPVAPPAVAVQPSPRRTRPYAEVGLGAGIRPDTGPAAGVHLAAGIAIPRVRLALAVGGSAPHALTVAGEERRVQSAEVLATAALGGGPVIAGLGLGASLRQYSDDLTTATGVVPIARLEVRGSALAAGALRIEPTLRTQYDLRTTTIAVNGEPVGDLSRWGAQLLVAVVYPP